MALVCQGAVTLVTGLAGWRKTVCQQVVDPEGAGGYSCRKASIGSKREARKAGTMPLTSPTAPRMSVDAISVPGAIIRRISPASPFLAKALYKVSLPTESATE